MTQISHERRDELLREMEGLSDDADADSGTIPKRYVPTCGELRALLADSAWRGKVEPQVRELAEWQDAPTQMQLRAIVDTGEQEGV